jgi:hypothetical protein
MSSLCQTLTHVTAHHEITGTSGSAGMTPHHIAKTGKERAVFRRMIHERPDHRVEIVCKTVGGSRPRLGTVRALEQNRRDRQIIVPAGVPA